MGKASGNHFGSPEPNAALMIICLDTNVFVQARAENHNFFPILDARVAGKLTLAVSTEILFKNEEVVARLSGLVRWQKFARLMDCEELTSRSLLRVTPQYHFQVINHDPDDNIFTDCGITAGTDFIVIEDYHFAPLAIGGYHPQPINPSDSISKYL